MTELRQIAISTQAHVIPAGRELPISTGGNSFLILSATGDVEVKLGQGDFNRIPPGIVVFDERTYFRDLVIRDRSGADNAVEFIVSTGNLRDNRFVASGQVDVGGDAIAGLETAIEQAAVPYVANITNLDGVRTSILRDSGVITNPPRPEGAIIRWLILSGNTGEAQVRLVEPDGVQYSTLLTAYPGQTMRLDNFQIDSGHSLSLELPGGFNSGIACYGVEFL